MADVKFPQLITAFLVMGLSIVCALLTAAGWGTHINCNDPEYAAMCANPVDVSMSIGYWFDEKEYNALEFNINLMKAHVAIFLAEVLLFITGLGLVLIRVVGLFKTREGKMDLCTVCIGITLSLVAAAGEIYYAAGFYMRPQYYGFIVVDSWYVSAAGLIAISLVYIADAIFICVR